MNLNYAVCQYFNQLGKTWTVQTTVPQKPLLKVNSGFFSNVWNFFCADNSEINGARVKPRLLTAYVFTFITPTPPVSSWTHSGLFQVWTGEDCLLPATQSCCWFVLRSFNLFLMFANCLRTSGSLFCLNSLKNAWNNIPRFDDGLVLSSVKRRLNVLRWFQCFKGRNFFIFYFMIKTAMFSMHACIRRESKTH